MQELIIRGTDETPQVTLSSKKSTFEISGTSMPENVHKFYTEVLEWIREYAQDPRDETVVNFKLIYFNTSSSKMIMDILLIFDEISDNGEHVELNWYYKERDLDMREAGEDYDSLIENELKLIPYT